MPHSARRWTGTLIALALVAGTVAMAVWRVRVAQERGWAGFVAVAQQRADHAPAPPMLFGWRPGAVVLLHPGGPADRAGINVGDQVDSVNGVSTRDWKATERVEERIRRGDVAVFRIRRGGVTRDVAVRFESPLRATGFAPMLAVSALVAVVFLAIGLFIFWRDPVDRRAVIFFVMTVVATVYLLSSAAVATEGGSNARGVALEQGLSSLPQIGLYTVTFFLFAPLLLHLALIFPKPRPVIVDRPEILRWIYGPPAVVLAAIAVLMSAAFAMQAGVRPLAYAIAGAAAAGMLGAVVRLAVRVWRDRAGAFAREPLTTQIVTLGLLACALVLSTRLGKDVTAGMIAGAIVGTLVIGGFLIYPVATVVALYRTYRESGLEEKRQVQWPLWATAVVLVLRIVCGGVVGTLRISRMIHGQGTVSLSGDLVELLPRLLYVLIPMAFAFAIVKYRLMNIDLIIRRTVTYAILSAVVFVVYGVLLVGAGALLVHLFGVRNQAVLVGSTIVVALIAVPLRNRLQRVVDHNVFRERLDYPLALRTLADAVSAGAAREELLRLLAEQLQQALQNRFVLVAMRSERHFVAAAKVGVADEILGTFRVPVDKVDFARPADTPQLSRLGTALVVPIRAQRDAIGFVALGAKLSNEDFSADDVQFLDAATSQVALALETTRLRGEEADYEQARAMQQMLLPKSLPRLDGFELAGMWHPARSVGGDYYDAIDLGGGKAAVCIADVAGKGMPAALLMAGLQAAVKATASADTTPSRLCDKVRRVVSGNLEGGTFITFFYALLDTGARTLTYCNAGHNPPLLVRATGEVERLDAGGSVLGRLFRAETYAEASLALEPGDRVVLFTDGVSEARRGDEDFGDERLIDVARAHRELGASELQEKIVEAITAFTSGNFGDDVTLVVIGAN